MSPYLRQLGPRTAAVVKEDTVKSRGGKASSDKKIPGSEDNSEKKSIPRRGGQLN